MNTPELPEAIQNPTLEDDLTPVPEIAPKTTEELLRKVMFLFHAYNPGNRCTAVIAGIDEFLDNPEASGEFTCMLRALFYNTTLEDIKMVRDFLEDELDNRKVAKIGLVNTQPRSNSINGDLPKVIAYRIRKVYPITSTGQSEY
jgi:hypothetical protein